MVELCLATARLWVWSLELKKKWIFEREGRSRGRKIESVTVRWLSFKDYFNLIFIQCTGPVLLFLRGKPPHVPGSGTLSFSFPLRTRSLLGFQRMMLKISAINYTEEQCSLQTL